MDSVDNSFGIMLNSDANLPGRQALTDTVIDYLSNFMRTGDPNCDGLPLWTAWSNAADADKLITLDADLIDAIIGTSNEALTEEGILNEMNSLYGPDITQYILSFSII